MAPLEPLLPAEHPPAAGNLTLKIIIKTLGLNGCVGAIFLFLCI